MRFFHANQREALNQSLAEGADNSKTGCHQPRCFYLRILVNILVYAGSH